MLKTSAKQLLDQIGQVLDLSSLEAGHLVLQKNAVQLSSFLEELVHLHRTQAKLKNLELHLSLDLLLPEWVLADAQRMNQVLSNLLGNALKYTPSGEVEIVVEPLETVEQLQEQLPHAPDDVRMNLQQVLQASDPKQVLVLFLVRDTGVGISHAAQEKVFEEFERGDASTAVRYGGSGLGLSIALRLAKAMNGWLDVSSQLGQGSCFSFVLPLQETAGPKTDFHLPL